MPFPDNLRRQCLAQFLSQAELARRSDLHTLTISRLETGRAKPSSRSVRSLADALGITPGELATPEEVAEADKGALPIQRRTRDGAISMTGRAFSAGLGSTSLVRARRAVVAYVSVGSVTPRCPGASQPAGFRAICTASVRLRARSLPRISRSRLESGHEPTLSVPGCDHCKFDPKFLLLVHRQCRCLGGEPGPPGDMSRK